MRLIAKTRTQVRMYGIVQPGEMIDIEEDRIDDRIKANFTPESGAWPAGAENREGTDVQPPKKDKEQAKDDLLARTAERMGRQAIIAALESAGIAFATTENTKYLARKYLQSLGEDV